MLDIIPLYFFQTTYRGVKNPEAVERKRKKQEDIEKQAMTTSVSSGGGLKVSFVFTITRAILFLEQQKNWNCRSWGPAQINIFKLSFLVKLEILSNIQFSDTEPSFKSKSHKSRQRFMWQSRGSGLCFLVSAWGWEMPCISCWIRFTIMYYSAKIYCKPPPKLINQLALCLKGGRLLW